MSHARFVSEFVSFRAAQRLAERQESVAWDDRYECLDDRSAETGFDRHYTYHPAWAARILAETRPESHVDISSIISFSAMVSAFVPIRFYDYRPAQLILPNLECDRADLTALHFADDSISSLSCMHVIEHVGLGRYGDPIDPNGDIKALREIVRVMAPRGNFLIVVPVGRERIQFNAHRVYNHRRFLSYIPNARLVQFSLIPDEGGMIDDPEDGFVDKQAYGCGCYWLRKI
jgi:SAM-dependent methyltransferase